MACVLHRVHVPAALTAEHHHVIPRAWQLIEGPKLWHPQTIELCPTAHRNVHAHLVVMMKWMAANGPDPAAAFRARKSRTREARVAFDGIRAYHDTGRRLEVLLERDLFGYA